jgi:hypothetical protein
MMYARIVAAMGKLNRVNYVIGLVFVLLVFLKVVPAMLFHFDLWYPIDDAYIYHQFASNLASGHFLTYSIGEPLANGCSSFLYYLLYAAVMFLAKQFWAGAPLFKTSQVFMMAVNFALYAYAIVIFKKIFEHFVPSAKSNTVFWALLSVFSVNAVLFSAASGLEVALTLLLVMLETYFLVAGEYDRLFITMLFANLNRPENITMNAFILIYLYLGLMLKKIRLNRPALMYLGLAQISIFILPLMNYHFIGSFFSSSAARVGVTDSSGGLAIAYRLILNSQIKNLRLLMFFPLIFIIPEYYMPSVEALRLFSLLLLAPTLLLGYYWHSLGRLKKEHFLIVLVFCSYLALPFITGAIGEWSRYVVPVFPLFLLLLYAFCSQINLRFMGLIVYTFLIVNLALFPVWCYYSFECTKLEHRFLWPIAKYMESHLKPTDKVGIDSAGILAVMNPGTSVDVYGLGTQRYSKIHGDFGIVYQQVLKDKLTYFVTWRTALKTYYLDTAHYDDIYHGKARLKEVFATEVKKEFVFHRDFPEKLVLCRVEYYK